MTPPMDALSLESLLTIARSYWDPDDSFYSIQECSPARERLRDLWDEKLKDLDPWNGFVRQLKGKLPGFAIGNLVVPLDASFRCIIYPPKESRTPTSNWVVVGCVSILAPVYAMYNVSYDYIDGKRHNFAAHFEPPPPNLRGPAHIVAQMIEETFGVRSLPHEVIQAPVPLFVDFKKPPETTLFHALFTSEPSSIL